MLVKSLVKNKNERKGLDVTVRIFYYLKTRQGKIQEIRKRVI